MPQIDEHQDVEAVLAIKSALDPLDNETRKRVLDAALALLGMTRSTAALPAAASPEAPPSPRASSEGPVPDIRGLRDKKKPQSDVEMAVLVSYYLAELAPSDDRRDWIGGEDIRPYFTQAGHELPTRGARDVLQNAKKAGYFDRAERGRYRLNPVGHNLAAYGLPRSESKPTTTKHPRKRASGKSKRKSKTSTSLRRSSRRR